jgi:hypothetical protein
VDITFHSKKGSPRTPILAALDDVPISSSTPKESHPELVLPPPWILFPFPTTASSSYLAVVVVIATEAAGLARIVLLVSAQRGSLGTQSTLSLCGRSSSIRSSFVVGTSNSRFVGSTKDAMILLRTVHDSLRGGLVNSSDGNDISSNSSGKASGGKGSEKGGEDSELHVGICVFAKLRVEQIVSPE